MLEKYWIKCLLSCIYTYNTTTKLRHSFLYYVYTSLVLLYSIRKISMTKKPILKMGKIFFDFNAYRIRMLCNINISPF